MTTLRYAVLGEKDKVLLLDKEPVGLIFVTTELVRYTFLPSERKRVAEELFQSYYDGRKNYVPPSSLWTHF